MKIRQSESLGCPLRKKMTLSPSCKLLWMATSRSLTLASESGVNHVVLWFTPHLSHWFNEGPAIAILHTRCIYDFSKAHMLHNRDQRYGHELIARASPIRVRARSFES